MKITWSWRISRRVLLWNFIALILSMPLAMGVAWIKTGINPYRILYYDYVQKHRYSRPLEDALHQAGTNRIYELLQAQPSLIHAWLDGDRPLDRAVGRIDSTNILALLLQYGANVNTRNMSGETALHKAAWVHDPAAEVFLLANGADWTIKADNGYTALDFAVGRSFKDIVEPLLAKGAKLNLYDSILLNNREEFLKLISADPSLVSKPCVSGEMPINLAASYGLREIVELLMQHGANVKPKGNPPLCAAAGSGQDDIVQLLIQHGADVNARDSGDRSALWLATGRLKTMKLLLSKGADVNNNNTNFDGATPLEFIATYRSRYPGPAPGLGTRSNRTNPPPPIRSFEQIRPKPANTDPIVQGAEPIKLLLEYHANPNLADSIGRTALHGVTSKEIAELLVNAGANINARDKQGRTPLRVAEDWHNTNVAAFLRSKGATE